MSENELILMILFLAALLAVFILQLKKIELEAENEALWKIMISRSSGEDGE